MRISRLNKIKRYWIFRDFIWPTELPAFAQYNVIYGWNGSGKTTLSSLFELLQYGQNISEGEVEFELDNGRRIWGTEISKINLPYVRVFNRNFIVRTIEAIGESNVAPIYFLGEESIAKQKQIKELKTRLAKAKETLDKADNDRKNAEKALDEFCIDRAKFIKETLLGSPLHANYDKRRFKEAINKLRKLHKLPTLLTSKDKEKLRKQKELKVKPQVPKISFTIPNLAQLRLRVNELIQRSIVAHVLEELASDPEVGRWVQQGLLLHTGERETKTCRFCGNEFTLNRRKELEEHFNEAFKSFQKEIEQTIHEIEAYQHTFSTLSLPDESRFYDHLSDEVKPALENVKQVIDVTIQVLDELKNVLETKKENPFEPLKLEVSVADEQLGKISISKAIEAVNTLIDRHETITRNLTDEIRNACQALEQNYVLESLPRFEELAKAVIEAKKTLSSAQQQSHELAQQIDKLEIEIGEHRRPAEELNHELRMYLGRDELKFEVKETGYALKRDNRPALNLSEGEKTAIAFLYFLKSLEDKEFDISKGIVVIDDPVSSLDANALFSAFGYMKERTKECHQLFLLTHNFAFFRQIKNWFHHLPGQRSKRIDRRPARFYMLVATYFDGRRNAMLTSIDPMLEQFESEYHFLFKQVYELANKSDSASQLADYYGIPNIARRLLETFLAYRFPDVAGDLFKKFERCNYDAEKKTKILRLLNTYSHSSGISDPEHDPSVLSETPETLKLVLELIETVDKDHYRGMISLMQPLEREE